MRVRFLNPDPKDGLGIPYPAKKDEDWNNNGYIDLKLEPHRLAEIHEMAEWPELAEFVLTLNEPKSFFKTLRCDTSAGDVKYQGFTRYVNAYLTVAFENLQFNGGEDNFRRLHDMFVEFLQTARPPTNAIAVFRMIPTTYGLHSYQGFSLDRDVTGFGMSQPEARSQWAAALSCLHNFLQIESKKSERWLDVSGARLTKAKLGD